jgi:hypothetical protein
MAKTKKLEKKFSTIPYPLVMIEWEDSARPISAWQWVEDYELPETILCVSVGYMISKTDKAVALAPNLGDVTRPKAQACGIIRIPQSAITQIWKLGIT